MSKRPMSRPSPAMVISMLALFVALSGSVAQATHPGGANTISSADIIDDEVKAADLGKGEVTTPKLATGAVTAPKLTNGAVRTATLGSEAVTTPKLADEAVTNAKIGFSAVDSQRVENGSLSGFDLAEDTVRGKNLQYFSILETGFVSTDTDVAVGEFDGSAPDVLEVMRVADTGNGGSGGLNTASLAGSTRMLQVTAIAVFRGAPDNSSEPECQLEGRLLSSSTFEPISQPTRTYVAETAAGLAGGQGTVTTVGGFVDDENVTDVRLLCRVINPGTAVEGDGTFVGGNIILTAYGS